MRLNTVIHGQADGVPLVIAHGLFGSARNWGAIARRLADRRRVVAVDMRNHGDSAWAEEGGYDEMAGDLAETAAGLGGPVDVLGHSMGGKAAMVLALTRPGLVRNLIVADIAPVTYGHTQAPILNAMRELDLSGLTRRAEADARLAATLADAGVRAFLLQSLAFGDDGPRWKLNLEALADALPRIQAFPALPGRFEGPAHFVTGERSDYVRPEHRAAIRSLFPGAEFTEVAGAGHWLHADQPRAFEAAVRQALGEAAVA